MYHRINAKKLNRTSSHRKALLKNMANSLIMHEQIVTTLPKAKALRPYVEKLVTLGKDATLSAKRLLLSKQQDKEVMHKLCDVMSKRYEARHGGYIRILKAGFRYGDNADMAVIEFVDRDVEAKGKVYNLRPSKSKSHEATKTAEANDVATEDKKVKKAKTATKATETKTKKVSVKSETGSKGSSSSAKGKSSVPRKTQGK